MKNLNLALALLVVLVCACSSNSVSVNVNGKLEGLIACDKLVNNGNELKITNILNEAQLLLETGSSYETLSALVLNSTNDPQKRLYIQAALDSIQISGSASKDIIKKDSKAYLVIENLIIGCRQSLSVKK